VTTARKSLPTVTRRADLGPLGAPVATEQGESLSIRPLLDDPSLLFKEYHRTMSTTGSDDQLDRLIALPGRLSDADRVTLTTCSCWPIARVVDDNGTVGVVIPCAPPKFSFSLSLINGDSARKPLEVDWLAMPDTKQRARGLPPVTFRRRVAVCRDLAAVAAILERENIVYGDWSYANAFWSTSDFRGYLIDVDTCRIGTRPWVHTPNWEDPLTPRSLAVDNNTDRYRFALLVARCLSGERAPGQAREKAQLITRREGRSELGEALTRSLVAADRDDRPSIAALHALLAGRTPVQKKPGSGSGPPGLGGVGSWKKIGAPASPVSPPKQRVPSRPAADGQRKQPVRPQAVSASPSGKAAEFDVGALLGCLAALAVVAVVIAIVIAAWA
jgi:hypothetical protein